MIITNIATYYDNHPLDMYQREQPASVGTIFFYSDLILTDKSRDTQTVRIRVVFQEIAGNILLRLSAMRLTLQRR